MVEIKIIFALVTSIIIVATMIASQYSGRYYSNALKDLTKEE